MINTNKGLNIINADSDMDIISADSDMAMSNMRLVIENNSERVLSYFSFSNLLLLSLCNFIFITIKALLYNVIVYYS